MKKFVGLILILMSSVCFAQGEQAGGAATGGGGAATTTGAVTAAAFVGPGLVLAGAISTLTRDESTPTASHH
jgi:hypothetical protein